MTNSKYIFLEHTADIKFQAFGKTVEEAFENSAFALNEVIYGKLNVKSKIKKEIIVKGKDFESLLYNFIEEFLFLLDSESFLMGKIKSIKLDEKNFLLKAVVLGDKASNYKFTNDVKAITYNSMFVRKEKNKWITQVVLDV